MPVFNTLALAVQQRCNNRPVVIGQFLAWLVTDRLHKLLVMQLIILCMLFMLENKRGSLRSLAEAKVLFYHLNASSIFSVKLKKHQLIWRYNASTRVLLYCLCHYKTNLTVILAPVFVLNFLNAYKLLTLMFCLNKLPMRVMIH